MEFFCATTAKQAFIFAGSTIFYLGTLSEAEKGRCPTVSTIFVCVANTIKEKSRRCRQPPA